MKKSLFLLSGLLLVAAFSCTPMKTEEEVLSTPTASAVSVGSVASSGATTNPDSLAGVLALGMGASGDTTLMTMMQSITSEFSSPTPMAASISRALSQNGADQIADAKAAIDALQTTGSANISIDLSAEEFGDYLNVTEAKATVAAKALTANGEAYTYDPETYKHNATAVTGNGTLSLRANLVGIPAESSLKALIVNVNGAIKGTMYFAGGYDLEYALSARAGVSINQGGTGGKILLTVDSAGKGSVSKAEMADPNAVSAALNPTLSIKLEVFSDDGVTQFSKTWTSVDAMMSDIQAAMTPPSAE